VPYLYPSALGRTNLAVVAGVGAPMGWNRAVILDKSGNKVETFTLYYSLALSMTRPADYQTVRTKLINAAHISGLYPPYTSVSYPIDGETLIRNRAYNITWDHANLGGNVQIVLYKGGVSNSTITASATNSGTYSWTVPAAQTEASDYKVRVTPLSAPTKFDDSNANFTIRNAKTTVSYPNGGESFSLGDSLSITWQPDGVTGNIMIELHKGGYLDSTIIASTANSGSYSWTVPANLLLGTNYTIRVTPLTDATAADTSDANFTLDNPVYAANMDSNPGWALEGEWEYGPIGSMSETYSTPPAPPSSAHSGTQVIGYDLNGTYSNGIVGTFWATTPAFDCTYRTNVTLNFWRYLGVYNNDKAWVQVKNSTGTWQTVYQSTTWENTASWTLMTYNISATADRKTGVQIRFGIGPTPSVYPFCGLYVDDLRVKGDVIASTNGTPYSWLAANGITSNQEANELLDPDNDGMPTWMEYQAGTDPNDSNSVFAVFNMGLIAGANTITWYGTTNSGIYTDFIIDRCTNLSSYLWTPVGTNSRSGSGTNVWTDSNPPVSGPAFYRPRLR